MHGQFARDMEDKDKNNTWRCMRKGDLKGCTEALICSAQNNLCELTISTAILTKLATHLCVGCMVQEMRLSHIVIECGNRVCDKEREKIEKYSLLKTKLPDYSKWKRSLSFPL